MARSETPVTQALINQTQDHLAEMKKKYETQLTRQKIIVGGYVINRCKKDINFALDVYMELKNDVKKPTDRKAIKEFIDDLENLLNIPEHERIFKAETEKETKDTKSKKDKKEIVAEIVIEPEPINELTEVMPTIQPIDPMVTINPMPDYSQNYHYQNAQMTY